MIPSRLQVVHLKGQERTYPYHRHCLIPSHGFPNHRGTGELLWQQYQAPSMVLLPETTLSPGDGAGACGSLGMLWGASQGSSEKQWGGHICQMLGSAPYEPCD